MQASALLLVFMDVGTEATEEEFHDWYTDEHVPLRTQKLASFRSASRYRAIDGIAPKFAAMYTVSDLATFSDPAYTALREQRSERETELIGRLSVIDRRIYSIVSDTMPLPDALKPTSVATGIVVYNSFTPAEGTEQAFHDWYEKEYIPAVNQIPAFHRTRRYKLEEHVVSGLKKAEIKPAPKYLEISEFETLSALHDPNFPSETAGQEIISKATNTERRVFKLIRSFEPTAALRSLRTPNTVTPSSVTPPVP